MNRKQEIKELFERIGKGKKYIYDQEKRGDKKAIEEAKTLLQDLTKQLKQLIREDIRELRDGTDIGDVVADNYIAGMKEDFIKEIES